MTSRWRLELTSSLAVVLLTASPVLAQEIRTVRFTAGGEVPRSAFADNSVLRSGVVLSDSLLNLETLRIDSLCFSYGKLAATVSIDTLEGPAGIDVLVSIDEGEHTRIGSVNISGSATAALERSTGILGVSEGDPFYPADLEAALRDLLAYYSASGYPYAQVWLIGFDYDRSANRVNLSISIFEGEMSTVSRVTFDGLTRTDSTFARRVCRVQTGSRYDEKKVAQGRAFLRAAGVFEQVGEAVVKQLERGSVDVVYPVKEMPRGNLFQGALGVTQKDGGDYVVSGAVDLELKHIAGRGRDAHLSWINNGERYSMLELSYHEPFLISSLLSLDAEVKQVVQDSIYVYHSAGLFFGYSLGPRFTVDVGASVDRNIPDFGELTRSIRQRYRLGVRVVGESRFQLAVRLEGASRKSYFEDGSTDTNGQLLYRFESRVRIPFVYRTSLFWRAVSESVFSSREIHIAETYTLGGARTLRGYRESQFRGERIAYTNLEYWFGEEGALFLFDDVGAYYRSGEGWVVKNGLGFGLRSSSPFGMVSLSFGVGDQLSLGGTRIHISLMERF
jgi:outer membrane protein assembly factor BamA